MINFPLPLATAEKKKIRKMVLIVKKSGKTNAYIVEKKAIEK